MSRVLARIWQRGVVSTFLAGFFVVLPVVITIGIMGWVGGLLAEWLGPGSAIGGGLRSVGGLVAGEAIATVVGWVIVLAVIWSLGVLVKTMAKNRAEKWLESLVNRVPILKSIYGPVSQVVGMVKGDDDSQMQSMSVVFCDFGAEHGGGFLALLTGWQVYRFSDQDCHLVYIPTSPVPMSGGIVFVPTQKVQAVDMDLDALMQIYFSLGVMATKTVPANYQVAASSD
jgi:uncharacterized membrane protein